MCCQPKAVVYLGGEAGPRSDQINLLHQLLHQPPLLVLHLHPAVHHLVAGVPGHGGQMLADSIGYGVNLPLHHWFSTWM